MAGLPKAEEDGLGSDGGLASAMEPLSITKSLFLEKVVGLEGHVVTRLGMKSLLKESNTDIHGPW